jgi:hypothetical protein
MKQRNFGPKTAPETRVKIVYEQLHFDLTKCFNISALPIPASADGEPPSLSTMSNEGFSTEPKIRRPDPSDTTVP